MRRTQHITSAAVALLVNLCMPAGGAQPLLNIQSGVELNWPTTTGNTYRAQWSLNPGGPWADLGVPVPGTGATNLLYDPVPIGTRHYQVLEMVPGSGPVSPIPVNGSFESGTGTSATNWSTSASQPPVRSSGAAHTGSFSMRCALTNLNGASSEGILSQLVAAQGGTVVGGRTYDFSFWARQVSVGPSYVQQYQVQWRNAANAIVGDTSLVNFNGVIGAWAKVSVPGLVAPADALEVRVQFRFVTGAVAGGYGEVFIDDVALDSGGASGGPGQTNVLQVASQPMAKITWPTTPNIQYQPESNANLAPGTWTNLVPMILGDGGTRTLMLPMTRDSQFVRLRSPSVNVTNGIVPLFDADTPLEAPTTIDTDTALVTHVADRARDRHAREATYSLYDHYLSWYWEERTIAIEIVDRVAKGGTNVTFNYTTLTPLSAPEFRAFFRGITTVAEYNFNYSAPLIGSNLYSATLSSKLPENRPLQIGDRVEIEISQFIQAPMHGRNNYYGTAILYIVGQGIVPWQGLGPVLDSYPLPEAAWLGGQTTLPYQYSNEPEHRFKQTAGNIAPTNAQPFMLGRRLHHTDFGTGAHSEPGNPIYAEQVGKLGPKFVARSCVECHVNNGRALPPAIGAPMLQTVVKVGSDANGTPHPILGSVLQPQSTSGPAEGGATIASYTNFDGQYGDGTLYSLQKPEYAFQGITPSYFSARLAPQLVGMGLLEAVSESTIIALADPDDADQDGISGRIQTVLDPETGDQRLGRFGNKAGKARLRHQIAGALNTDMGVTTPVFPILDGETTGAAPELDAADLDKWTRYLATLGVSARRDLTNAQALQGEQLFNSAQCTKCHVPTLTTSPYHPMTELRNQTIHPYTDLLLHDMGPGLADNLGELGATGSEWRTPPLWSIGLTAGVSGGEAYLHDGRARSLEEAILWHGGEAETAKETFRTMSTADRTALIQFLKSL